jgi:hypothetical protein
MYNLYVDGESHYAMAEKCIKNALGQEASLENVKFNKTSFVVHPPSKFFWSPEFVSYGTAIRRVYFTSFVGTPDTLHEAKVFIRGQNFEPQVILEEKDKEKQRANQLTKQGILIKPKGLMLLWPFGCWKMLIPTISLLAFSRPVTLIICLSSMRYDEWENMFLFLDTKRGSRKTRSSFTL